MRSFTFIFIVGLFCLTNSTEVVAQHHPRGARHHNRPHHQPVYRSPHRPATITVFHPHWATHRDFHRRWVYFPKHHLYWDNWRNLYFFYNGTAWVSSPTPPPHLGHLKLENEKHKELNESDDEDDEIYLHRE